MRTGLIAALDIGSTKVCCLIAHADTQGVIRVAGIGHQASRGIRAGAIVEMEAAETAIVGAVSAAEQHAGERVREALVNLSTGRPASKTMSFEMQIGGHAVGERDLRRILGQCNGNAAGERALVHAIPTAYSLDGNAHVRDPRGLHGETLGVEIHVVSADPGSVRNLESGLARCHLAIEDTVVSPFAAGLGCLVEDEKDLGVTLVDMGGGTTTIAVFFEGTVIHVDSIAVGGQHVTSDIARGLSTPLVHAERMKTLYGSALPSPSDEREIIDVPLVGEEHHDHANHVPRSMLTGIIRPRLEETFELVRSRLEAGGMDRVAGRRLVLTGGASQLPGARELAALVLEKQVRLGRPLKISGLADATSGPAFSVAAGLLRYAVERRQPDLAEEHSEPAPQAIGRVGRLGRWLRENF